MTGLRATTRHLTVGLTSSTTTTGGRQIPGGEQRQGVMTETLTRTMVGRAWTAAGCLRAGLPFPHRTAQALALIGAAGADQAAQ